MSTRSVIAIREGELFKSVYCHFDGYPEHNGVILYKHYDLEKTKQLIALGDLSSLGEEIGQQHDFSDITKPKWCKFYGRDRQETDVDFVVDKDLDSFLEHAEQRGAEFYYVLMNNKWFFGSFYGHYKNKLAPVEEVIDIADPVDF